MPRGLREREKESSSFHQILSSRVDANRVRPTSTSMLQGWRHRVYISRRADWLMISYTYITVRHTFTTRRDPHFTFITGWNKQTRDKYSIKSSPTLKRSLINEPSTCLQINEFSIFNENEEEKKILWLKSMSMLHNRERGKSTRTTLTYHFPSIDLRCRLLLINSEWKKPDESIGRF